MEILAKKPFGAQCRHHRFEGSNNSASQENVYGLYVEIVLTITIILIIIIGFKFLLDMQHGFCAARGDYSNELVRKRATEAIQLTVQFFDEVLIKTDV